MVPKLYGPAQQGPRSTRASTSAHKQLPPWMAFIHLPEHGLVSSHSKTGGASVRSASTTHNNNTDNTKLPSKRQSSRNMASIQSCSIGTNNNLNTSYTAPQVSSNNKTKKNIAVDSLYPPTIQEIYGHIRYLSEEGMQLVMEEIDECVRYTLKYSSNKKHAKGIEKKLSSNNSKPMKGFSIKDDDLIPLATEIYNYFDLFQPDEEGGDEEDNTINATSALSLKADKCIQLKESTGGNDVQRQDILYDMLPNKYDPTLLPMVSIKCYPNVLDRLETTKGLLSDLSKKKHSGSSQNSQIGDGEDKSPCVCIVKSTSELVQQGHIMTEVLSQCISNDPNGEAFAMELQRQRKRQKSQNHGGVNRGTLIRSIWSWTQSLVDWAGFTEAFDSIVVILEDPEKIPSPTLDSFFTTLASLRANNRVPICAVVIDATPGGLGDRLSKLRYPSLRGTSGVVARELLVPLPRIQLDLFINRLFSGKCIPTFLWSNRCLLTRIQELFQDSDNSIVSVAKKLKTDLRRYFSVPGSFISLLNCERFTVPNESRIKWLFGDDHCRKIMLSYSSSTSRARTKMKVDGHISDLFWKMQTFYLCHQVCQRINEIFNLSPLGVFGLVSVSEFHLTSRIHELILLLSKVRHTVSTWEEGCETIHSDRSVSFRKKLNEYIVLAGQFLSNDDKSNASMARSFVENIIAWTSDNISLHIKLNDSRTVQPRRDVAKALHMPMPDALVHCSLAHASHIALQVLQSRVMTLSSWHEKYFNVVTNQEGQDSGVCANKALFFFAVRELVHLGFVRKLTTGRRKEEAYEKVAIIWTNGR